jgi:hypothetical protein
MRLDSWARQQVRQPACVVQKTPRDDQICFEQKKQTRTFKLQADSLKQIFVSLKLAAWSPISIDQSVRNGC